MKGRISPLAKLIGRGVKKELVFWIQHALLAFGAVFALVAVGPAQASAASSPRTAVPDFAAIDRYVQEEMEATRLPGASLGIVKGDEIVHLKGFGDADDSGRKVTPQTPFLIGSNGKSFTALAIMQLVEDGKVELDAPVQRYIPWFRVADPEASERITVRHLLNQTSGLPTASGQAYLLKEDSSKDALENEVRSMSDVELTHPPGETYQYCNLNYTTLWLIVQIVSGEPYERYVEEHILVPLRMEDSFMSPPAAERHGLATGHQYWFGQPFSGGGLAYNRAATPAGLMASSAEDMSHYLIAQLNGGRYEGAEIVSEDGIAELHRGAADIGEANVSYAMGWVDSKTDGVHTVWHEGSTGNVNANMILLPESKWGIVLLTNGDDLLRGERMDQIPVGVMNLLLGRQPPQVPLEEFLVIFLVVLGVFLLQVIGGVRSVVLLRRWRAHPAQRPRGVLRVGLRVVVPLVLNLLWAVTLLVILPRLAESPLWTMVFYDVGLVAVLSGGLALVWGGILRPVLVLLALRKTGAPNETGAAVEA
jgi:CubicO group peptidase (beta-lactamase class C family)